MNLKLSLYNTYLYLALGLVFSYKYYFHSDLEGIATELDTRLTEAEENIQGLNLLIATEKRLIKTKVKLF